VQTYGNNLPYACTHCLSYNEGVIDLTFSRFAWIEDNSGGNVGTVAEDMYENGHKIGIMD
jgi:hypothetical protein